MKLDITVEVLHSGLRLSAIYKHEYYSKLYIGYSRREAIALFKCYIADEQSKIIVEQSATKPHQVLNSYLSGRPDNILITSEGDCYCHACAKKNRNDLRSSIKILDISFRVINPSELDGELYCESCSDELTY